MIPNSATFNNLAKPALKTLAILLTAGYFLYYASTPDTGHFLDNASLLIHEAGHVVFMPFGNFLYVLGGSLTQVIIPLIFVVYFFRQGQKLPSFLLLFWLGQNLINVSVYAGDAVTMQLPLLTGDKDSHDWNYLLVYLGWLHYTKTVAAIIYYSGIAAFIAGLGLSTKAAWQDQAKAEGIVS